ncbi:hypothetical protein [Enterovibrio norvegicus]|uniref:Uncharacterized protein n=1 Tax=Enterovibrio norvegicus TaxID=188144 RepID=A0A2N7LFQ6_9GAMM|nr:hypothetical protein [Enterovibrio norvegicus]PMN94297.1 hypothetical protein BCT23_10670 [Enterovibrio norvegicus]
MELVLLFYIALAFIGSSSYQKFFGFRERAGELRYSPYYKTMAFFITGLSFLLMTLYYKGLFDESEELTLIFLIIASVLGGLSLLLEFFFTKGVYEAESISFYSVWRGERKQKWADLVECVHKGDRIRLRFAGGTKITVSVVIGGLEYLIKMLETKGYKLG